MQKHKLINILTSNENSFHPIVPFNSSSDKLLKLDFTDANKDLSSDILLHPQKFDQYINETLESASARYGIGGYNEHRIVYAGSSVFDAEQATEEPRRLHLGVDIWGEPLTPVMAPLAGNIHSFAFNDQFGDYGATIILEHQLEEVTFYTLYGHLSLNSIKNLKNGGSILKGETFAAFGIPSENGNWPPHLHFQIIIDIGTWFGDYPGVCKFSEREKWLANSPDPDSIVQLEKYL